MADAATPARALGDNAARQLANATKTVPQYDIITPRWLVRCLQWVPVEAGVFRLNRVKDASSVAVDCADRDERDLPETYVNYEENPREYLLCAVTTVVDGHTRVSDLYSVPHNQIAQQLRLAIETIKERQESELVNNSEYGLLSSAAEAQKISTRDGAPTPDDLDSLIAKVIAMGTSRDNAIARMTRALGEYLITGIKTTIPFQAAIMRNPDFLRGDYNTGFVEKIIGSRSAEFKR